MIRNALLGFFLIAFCVAILVVGIVRLAPGRGAGDLALAAIAAILGVAVFAFVVRIGRRGTLWTRWVFVPMFVAASFVDRLSTRDQLALIALGAGYVGSFIVTIVVRGYRLMR